MSVWTSRNASVTPSVALRSESYGCGDDAGRTDGIRLSSARVRRSESVEERSGLSVLTEERDRLQWELGQAKQKLKLARPSTEHSAVDVIGELRACVAGARKDIQTCNSNKSNLRLTRADEMLYTASKELTRLGETCQDQNIKNTELFQELTEQVQDEEERRIEVSEQLKRLIGSTTSYLGEIRQCLEAQPLPPPMPLPVGPPVYNAQDTSEADTDRAKLAAVKQKISSLQAMAKRQGIKSPILRQTSAPLASISPNTVRWTAHPAHLHPAQAQPVTAVPWDPRSPPLFIERD
eukprot:TRINITY_DN19278_c0_g1_i1.p1 TRINITY_DN19278_c0_g1~~TRINITY_DN19278_c0_g1_i1.p1  ORF type:complete len:293 (+),score=27.97 TRINITY_DN19278_c0_g1_i1:41-919(+)